MKIAYAFRRSTFYPFIEVNDWVLTGVKTRADYLKNVRDIGFD